MLLELMLQASKTHPSPHRNTMLLKDGTTSKNMLPWGLTSLLDSGKNKASSAAGPAGPAGPAAAAPAAAAALVLQASKTYPSPHRNTMLLKDGTTSKNMLPWGLTSLLDSDKNKASSAAGPAAAGGGRGGGDAAGAGAAGLPDGKTPWRQNVAQKLPNVSSVSSETVENCVKHGLPARLKPEKNCVKHVLPAALLLL